MSRRFCHSAVTGSSRTKLLALRSTLKLVGRVTIFKYYIYLGSHYSSILAKPDYLSCLDIGWLSSSHPRQCVIIFIIFQTALDQTKTKIKVSLLSLAGGILRCALIGRTSRFHSLTGTGCQATAQAKPVIGWRKPRRAVIGCPSRFVSLLSLAERTPGGALIG